MRIAESRKSCAPFIALFAMSGRVASMSREDPNPPIVQYIYDAEGARIGKATDDSS